jgi:hypothetical protein
MRKSIVYAVAALGLLGCRAVHATEIGGIAFHGADLRSLCHSKFAEMVPDTGLIPGLGDEARTLDDINRQLCSHRIDRLINENVEKLGRTTEQWDIPASAQLEDLEKNVRNYMSGGTYKDLEQADAHVLVAMVLSCRYPSDPLKVKLATTPVATAAAISKECATIYGKKGN